MLQKYKITEPYINLDCGLGEAPFFEESHNSLRFVDIVKRRIYFVDLAVGPSSLRHFELPISIGTTADISTSLSAVDQAAEFVFGGKEGYGIMNRDTGEWRYIKRMWGEDEKKEDGGGKPGKGRNKEERMRSNDGAVDRMGRFWVGAMNDPAVVGDGNFTDEGILFRLDPDLTLHRTLQGVTIPNGTSWSPDDKTMYFTDSPSGSIKAYPYDPSTGDVDFSQGRVFWSCPVPGGVPDGHCVDEEGHLWVAGFGTGKVFRVNPAGEVVAEVECPTACVTCPGLCGTELFITSAQEEDPEARPESARYQGGLFKVDVGVKGAPLNKFRLDVEA